MNHSNKRKRQDDEVANPFFKPFAATLHPQPTNTSYTFVPVAHLRRADLPLIWLDHGVPPRKAPISTGALLNARLETVHSHVLQDHMSGLVARSLPNGGLYFFERVREDVEIYISVRLQPWITESRIIRQSLGRASSPDDDLKVFLDAREMTVFTKHLPSASSSTPKKPQDRRGAIARMAILPVADVSPNVEIPQAAFLQVPVEAPAADVANEPFTVDCLRAQYLEALYTTTSLAYFAKGPLSRARKEVASEELLAFYRESIIPTKKLDLKYKDSVNKVMESVKVLPPEAESIDHPKAKASRKKRMGKDVLYPAEAEHIQRCWSEREVGNARSTSAQSQSQEQRKLVSKLRTRETKMQILLILEALALQSSIARPQVSTFPPTITLMKTEQQADDTATILAKTPVKAKADSKTKSYSFELETLVDRLCIWHTVGIDDMLGSPGNKDHEAQESSSKKDELRDFCAETIVPFYNSRLPEQSNMICTKLGGPALSPERPKAALTKSASMSQLPPGAAIQRRPRAVPRKTLERVLSDEKSMRHASPPTLARSSTAPQVPNLKRERSESIQRPGSRGALHKSVSFSNREIDLDADARLQEAKQRKLARVAEQKKQLGAAIAALKKPDRTVAAQSLMDEIEGRAIDGKAKKQSVHITTTPKRPKSRASSRHEQTLPPLLELNAPLLDDQVVPSSSLRPRISDPWRPVGSAKKRAVVFAIHETPARSSSGPQIAIQKPVSRLNLSGNANVDIISSDLPTVASAPAANRLRPDLLTQIENTPLRVGTSAKPMLFTPLKKGELRIEDVFRDAPIIPADAGKAMDRVMGGSGAPEMSVYDALGWNDDYDL